MSAFIHRFALTVFAAVLVTSGAQARTGDSAFATSAIERVSVEAWEAAQVRAYDAQRAEQVRGVERALHDGMRWAISETRHLAVAAAAEGQRLIDDMDRTIVTRAVEGHRFAAAIAESGRASNRDIVRVARGIAAEGRRLVAEARHTLMDAFAERGRVIAQAKEEAASAAARRLVAGVDRAFTKMVAEGRRAWASATARSTLAREAARDAAVTAGKAFRGGRSALRLIIAPRPTVKTTFRMDVENALGAVMTARFAAAPAATPAIRVWKLSRTSEGVTAALAGSAASPGLVQPAMSMARDGGNSAIGARLNAAMSAVQRVGAWLLSAR